MSEKSMKGCKGKFKRMEGLQNEYRMSAKRVEENCRVFKACGKKV